MMNKLKILCDEHPITEMYWMAHELAKVEYDFIYDNGSIDNKQLFCLNDNPFAFICEPSQLSSYSFFQLGSKIGAFQYIKNMFNDDHSPTFTKGELDKNSKFRLNEFAKVWHEIN